MPHAVSLILICRARKDIQKQVWTEIAKAPFFDTTFAFDWAGSTPLSPEVRILPNEAIGRSLLRRIEFFADPEDVLSLLTPLLVRSLWTEAGTRDVVIGYPGIPLERLSVASEMILAGCEAVLLRREDKAPLVVAMARSVRNERLVAHWADCVEQFSTEPSERFQFDPNLGAEIVGSLCDRIASIRDTAKGQSSSELTHSRRETVAPFIREAVRRLLPESQLLMDDPFANALVALNAPSSKAKQDQGNLITCLVFLAWSARPDLQAAFNISTFEGRRGLVDWFLTRAPIEFDTSDGFLAPIRAARDNAPNRSSEFPGTLPAENPADSLLGSQAGVNLVGYPRAEMGMGELLRKSAAALSAAKVRFCTIDFKFGITATQENARYDDLMRTENPYEVNLFHINADQMRLAREKLGPEFFRNHYNIGYWAWELSSFPNEWQYSIDLVDEIWAPSRFVRDAIAAKTAKPVTWMPPAIEFPLASEPNIESLREELNLPKHKFLFLFSFDFSSFGTRKNFQGCIQAFQKAFPKDATEAGLVLKTIRHWHQRREYWEMLRAVGDDERILLVDRVLPQARMRDLIAACDSFVSLHRSEGFGLGIAEAMYLGKPVIATNYSGNTDFTKQDNSCLVDYQLVPLKPKEYLFAEGAVWAAPDVDQAAEYMRRLTADRAYATALGRAASKFIREQYSCKKIGQRQVARLEKIGSARALLASFQQQEDMKESPLESLGKNWEQWLGQHLRHS